MERAAADEAATGRARKEALLAGIQALRRPEVQAVLAADDAAALEARILAQKEKRQGAKAEVRLPGPCPLNALRATKNAACDEPL